MNPTVFLGLVTHARTRFPEAATSSGLVHSLSACLGELGIPSVVQVHDADHYTPDLVAPTQKSVRESIDAELSLEREWRAYVNAAAAKRGLDIAMAGRRIYRRLRLSPPWHMSATATDAGAAMIRRLINIELAHLHLMAQALDTGAPWVLIVEDDARLGDPDAMARAMDAFIAGRSDEAQPAYVNVSRSFDTAELGLSDHLTDIGAWAPGVRMLSSDRPLTNTVCAILYRGAFLRTLKGQLDAIPVDPVIPIDWKVNAALLELTRDHRLGSGDCWFLDPAPILQGSMHDTA